MSNNEAIISASSLAEIKPLARNDGELIDWLERDYHLYLSAARGSNVDSNVVDAFTEAALA